MIMPSYHCLSSAGEKHEGKSVCVSIPDDLANFFKNAGILSPIQHVAKSGQSFVVLPSALPLTLSTKQNGVLKVNQAIFPCLLHSLILADPSEEQVCVDRAKPYVYGPMF